MSSEADDSGQPYDFRPAAATDLPMIGRWLSTPAVRRWWGDPAEQAALIASDLDDPRMTCLIVSHRGRPLAYAQHYALHHWGQTAFDALPHGSRGIDSFIGEPAMFGQGHGPAMLRLLARQLVAGGAPLVIVDPDPDNDRARRAYAKAGFQGDDLIETDDGPAVMMVFAG